MFAFNTAIAVNLGRIHRYFREHPEKRAVFCAIWRQVVASCRRVIRKLGNFMKLKSKLPRFNPTIYLIPENAGWAL